MRFKSKSILTAAASLTLVGATAITCLADTTQEQLQAAQSGVAQAESQLQQSQARISELATEKGAAEAYLTELQTQLTELTEELDSLETQCQDKQYELDQIVIALEDANEDKDTQSDAMSKRIQYMYENSSNSGTLTALFSADSFMDFINRASNLDEITSFDRNQLEEYADTCESIEAQELQLEAEKAAIEQLQAETEAKKEEITTLYNETNATVTSLANELAGEETTALALIEQVRQQEAVVIALASRALTEQQSASVQQSTGTASVGETATSDSGSGTSTASQSTTVDSSAADTSSSSGSSSSAASTYSYSGTQLTKSMGVNQGPTGKETYYNLNMSGVVSIMRSQGNTDQYWVRSDGVKMLGGYVMVAANLDKYPRGSLVDSSLGKAIVVDTGGFAETNEDQLDIATAW